MRVIAGIAKGHLLKAPKGMNTRPTTDRVREAIFSVLAGEVQEARVLDAFAGSGALGIEALSRGAANAVFFDRDRQAIAAIKANLAHTGFEPVARVVHGQVEKLLPPGDFNLVFLDPPYSRGFISAIEAALLQPGVLSDDVIVVLETKSKAMELFSEDVWECYKTSVYGDTAVVYYGLKSYQKTESI